MNTSFSPTAGLISRAVMPKVANEESPKVAVKPQVQRKLDEWSPEYAKAIRSVAMSSINFAKPVNYTEGINCKVTKEVTAEETNHWWAEEMNYNNPPYLPKSKVQHIKLEEDTKFCRVYDGEVSGMYGGWVMKASDLEGLSPEEIQDKFALPQCPKMMCDVTIPKGTEMRTGLCNPLEGWGKGGGTQFDLMGQRVGTFENERALPTAEELQKNKEIAKAGG